MSTSLAFNYDPRYRIFRLQLGSREIVGATEQECLLQAIEIFDQRHSRWPARNKPRKSWWPLG